MSFWRSLKPLALVCLAVDAVTGDRCPQKGCAATFEPVVADDGQVYLNSCVAACYGASIVRGGNPGAAAGRSTAASRRASPTVLLRFATQGYVFVGFAQTQKLSPLQQATVAADGAPFARRSISANIMQQLVKPHSVLRYDVATGAVYNVKAAGTNMDLSQLPGGVSHPAKQPQQQQDPLVSPAPIDDGGGNANGEDNSSDIGGDDEEPLILNPEIVIDIPIKRNSSSPSPSPSPAVEDSSNTSSPSPSPAVLEAGINSSSSSSPAPATEGSEAPASTSPSPAPSAAPTDANLSPSTNPISDAPPSTSATTTTNGAGTSLKGRRLRFVRKGNDERTDVSHRPAFPLSAVGQLLSHGQEWHCSASLIAERTIITAAHCVYDPLTGSWAKSLSFAPSRFRDTAGSVREPADTAAVAEVFIVGGFAVGEPQFLWEKDMAVVKLAPGTKLGSKLGHLGVFLPAAVAQQQRALGLQEAAHADVPAGSGSSTSGGSRKLKLQQQGPSAAAAAATSSNTYKSSWQGTLSTAGYPMDRQKGTLISTKCLSQMLPGTTPRSGTLKLLRCSTALGQSGGPLIDAAGNLGGVVSYEVLGPRGYNGGCAMTPWLWLNLVSPNLV